MFLFVVRIYTTNKEGKKGSSINDEITLSGGGQGFCNNSTNAL